MPAAVETIAVVLSTTTATSISNSTFGFTQLAGADKACVSATGNAIMCTWDGTPPTDTLGHRIRSNIGTDRLFISGTHNVNNLQFIAASTTGNATVTVTIEV